MSGIFWEPDHQPDLCEAVSGYTLSTVNLALAIPMAIVDLICCGVILIASLTMMVLNPVMDLALCGGAMALELLGVETWTHNTTIVSLLVTYNLVILISSSVGTGSFYQKSFSRLNCNLISIVWLINFLAFPVFENAVFSRVALVSIAIQGAELAVTFLFLEYNNFASAPRENAMNSIANGILDCFRMEVFAALIISAFGYPSFSQDDDITQYFCLAPILALQMIYFTSVRQTEASDPPPAALPFYNGAAVILKDSAPVETILESILKVQEVEENVVDKIVPEVNDEHKQKDDPSIEDDSLQEEDTPTTEDTPNEEDTPKVDDISKAEDNPNEDDAPEEGAASEIVSAVNTVAAVVDEKIGEAKNIVEEIVEEITEEVNEKLNQVTNETAQIIKEDALFKRIQTCVTSLFDLSQTQVLKVTNPVFIVFAKLLSFLLSLPWTTLLLFTLSSSSHFLYSYAWLKLTGNPLAYSLPVLSLLLPLLLPQLPLLPPQAKHCTGELTKLAIAGVQYALITAEEIEE